MISTVQDSFSARSPSTAACNSIRLFVVSGSEPYISRCVSPKRRMHAQPPGPGLPIHDPSVMSWTFFMSRSDGSCLELSLEKSIDLVHNLSGLSGLVDFHPEFGSVADAVGEVSGELFHLAHHVGHGTIAEHSVVSAHNLITLVFGGMFIGAGLEILLNLAEDPRIGRSGAADHDGVAAGFGGHSNGILRRAD